MSVIDRRKNPHALTYQAPADKARAAARPYWENPWRLINDKPEEIRAQIGDLYPAADVEELLFMLEDLRGFYRRLAAGEEYVLRPHLDEMSEKTFTFPQTVGAIEAITSFAQLWKDPEKVATAKRLDLTGALWFPLWSLLELAFRPESFKIYRCEYCGRIGRAERADKRYCDNVCRARASRARTAKGEC